MKTIRIEATRANYGGANVLVINFGNKTVMEFCTSSCKNMLTNIPNIEAKNYKTLKDAKETYVDMGFKEIKQDELSYNALRYLNNIENPNISLKKLKQITD